MPTSVAGMDVSVIRATIATPGSVVANANGPALTDSHGRVSGRDGDVAEATKRDSRYSGFCNYGQKMRCYGDTAIVNGITSVKGESGCKSFTGDFRFTDT